MLFYGSGLVIMGVIIAVCAIIGFVIIITASLITSSRLKKQLEKEYGKKG